MYPLLSDGVEVVDPPEQSKYSQWTQPLALPDAGCTLASWSRSGFLRWRSVSAFEWRQVAVAYSIVAVWGGGEWKRARLHRSSAFDFQRWVAIPFNARVMLALRIQVTTLGEGIVQQHPCRRSRHCRACKRWMPLNLSRSPEGTIHSKLQLSSRLRRLVWPEQATVVKNIAGSPPCAAHEHYAAWKSATAGEQDTAWQVSIRHVVWLAPPTSAPKPASSARSI